MVEVLDVQAWWKHGEFVEQGRNVWSVESKGKYKLHMDVFCQLTWRGIFNGELNKKEG